MSKVSMRVGISAVLLVSLTGCLNIYKNVDSSASGATEAFPGIRQYLAANGELHVLQTHGMGHHPQDSYCADNGENIELQRRIRDQLGFVDLPTDQTTQSHPIIIGKTTVGSVSTRVYVDTLHAPKKSLYFSCLTWGEASHVIKTRMLELSPSTYLELNENEKHRAYVNRRAKRFVNRSFADPIIYLGPFGKFIRQAVWDGIQSVEVTQSVNRSVVRSHGFSAPPREESSQATFLASVPMVVITDSLGSRVLFDVLCSNANNCGRSNALVKGDGAGQSEALARSTKKSIRSIFMFANQLPLLELASIEGPPPDQALESWLDTQPCLTPFGLQIDSQNRRETTVVAFTDPNDALSYHLSDKYKARCAPQASDLRIVNVTLPNSKFRLLGIYSSLGNAHASGFKTNSRAIRYLVDGNGIQH